MARTVQSQRKSSRVAKPPRRVPAFHNAKRLVKTLPAMKSMKSSGRYEPGTRKGRPNTSTKWPKGVRRGKNFIVSSLVFDPKHPKNASIRNIRSISQHPKSRLLETMMLRFGTSEKRNDPIRRGKNFIVSSLVLIEIGARYIVKVTGKNSFEVLKRHR